MVCSSSFSGLNFVFLLVCIDENVETIVKNGAIPALVKYLESPWSLAIGGDFSRSCDHKLEKDCAVALGLIAAIQVTQSSTNCDSIVDEK